MQSLPMMAAGSSVVLISSLRALNSDRALLAYGASKAAQLSLMRGMAIEGHDKAVRCNAVLPGDIDTPLRRSSRREGGPGPLPFGRQGTGWEVAQVALFLMSHESSYVNGQSLVVDGGLS